MISKWCHWTVSYISEFSNGLLEILTFSKQLSNNLSWYHIIKLVNQPFRMNFNIKLKSLFIWLMIWWICTFIENTSYWLVPLFTYSSMSRIEIIIEKKPLNYGWRKLLISELNLRGQRSCWLTCYQYPQSFVLQPVLVFLYILRAKISDTTKVKLFVIFWIRFEY